MKDKFSKTVKLLTFSDDQPHEEIGMLIPQHVLHPEITRLPLTSPYNFRILTVALIPIAVMLALVVLGSASQNWLASDNYALAPTVTIVDPNSNFSTTIEYGQQKALQRHSFFVETRDAFIEERMTFVEADLNTNQLRYFDKGVLLLSAEILATGEKGSWWDSPSGLYKIQKKEENPFSTLGQVYLPNSLVFQGNFVIHGLPKYYSKESAEEEFRVGGIRISDESAEKFYDEVEVGIPVLVHTEEEAEEEFVYELAVPELKTPHYLIADIENGAVLAANGIQEIVPIASLTKLMTAVVASEKLDLDSRVWVTSPTFVTSLIPRLSDRSSVSLYSLLQLLLVESSNEASEVIAGEVGREDFLDLLNTKARQLGMLNTNFEDPSGLSSENVSSVEDLFKLAKYIKDNREFIYEITAREVLPSAYISGEFGGLVNFNEIEDIDNFIGGKVGETNAAGQTSISLHEIEVQGETRTIVVILLGSEGRSDDVRTLLKFAESNFKR